MYSDLNEYKKALFVADQSFHWSYVLRVQIFIKSVEDINEDTICLEDILIEIKQRS